ncbi:hypothetical protein B0H19DRAFT_1274105 [Mycena capillaripes]|nr:hypothetical protein B0H19DRAFT_1274105 [Mycena capillaripes]
MTTLGVRSIFAHAWARLLDPDSGFIILPKHLIDLFVVLPTDMDISANFDEILEGVGGNYDDLAAVIVRHFAVALDFPTPDNMAEALGVVLSLLHSILSHHGEGPDAGLRSALISNGIIPALIRSHDALTGTTEPHAAQAIFSGFCNLEVCLCMGPMLPWVTDAVEAGLLQSIISGAVTTPRTPDGEILDIGKQLSRLSMLVTLRHERVSSPAVLNLYAKFLEKLFRAVPKLQDKMAQLTSVEFLKAIIYERSTIFLVGTYVHEILQEFYAVPLRRP